MTHLLWQLGQYFGVTPGTRAYDLFARCFEKRVLTRYTGDILTFSPPLIVEAAQIGEIFGTVAE